jgi:phosphate transport system protein
MSQMRGEFSEHLTRLRESILRIGTVADRMLDDAIKAVTDHSPDLTSSVIRRDDEADAIDADVEREAVLLIALQQPVASDLRVITVSLKAVNEMERIGDYAVDIAKIGRRIARRTSYNAIVDIARLAACVRGMLRDVLRAFVTGDTDLLLKVIQTDDVADDLYHQYRDYLIETMERQSSLVFQAANMLLACKYLERVGDHVVNVAEDFYYMHTGEFLFSEKKRKWQRTSDTTSDPSATPS